MKQRKPIIHGRDHARGGADPIPLRAVFHIKLFPDEDFETAMKLLLPVTAVADAFTFAVAADMHETVLKHMEAFVTTTGAAITVQVWNRTQAAVLGSAHIDAGEKNSMTATVEPETFDITINEQGDEIGIEVAGGAGAHGLGVILEFG